MQTTDFEKHINSLNGIVFEEMIQSLINSRFYFEDGFIIYETGKVPGMQHPSKSQIDIWFSYKKDGVDYYYLVAVTKQKTNVFGKNKKAEKDIRDMIVEAKKAKFGQVTLIYACNQNPSLEQVFYLKEICNKEGYEFEFWGLNVITSWLEHSPTVAGTYLNIPSEPSAITPLADYLCKKKYNASFDKQFLFRENEKKELIKAIVDDKKRVSIIHGPSGCGKTRLVIEVAKQLQSSNDYYCYIFEPISFDSVAKALGCLPRNKPVILIIDDANIYNFLNQHINNLLNKENIFVIMTLRDYLWNDFYKKINFPCYDAVLTPLKKTEIEEIVRQIYNITNKRYLDYLYIISRNNLRFALMATQLFVEKDERPKTVADVLEKYYEGILKESGVDKNDGLERTVVAISLLGRTDIRDDTNNNAVCKLFGIDINDFLRLCYEAQKKEFFSVFKNAIVEITDQVLAEYLIYKYIFVYKKISLIDAFDYLYKTKQSRIVWFFNALLGIYHNDECISQELESLKNNCLHSENQEKRYSFFRLFGKLFPNDCISFAIDFIKKNPNYFLKDYYHLLFRFSDEEEHFSQVAYWLAELLTDANTREATINFITENIKITVESVNNKYAFEIKLINNVLEKTKLNPDLAMCLFKIVKNFFSYETNYTEYENETKQVFFKRFIIPFSNEYKQLRASLWDCIQYLVHLGYRKEVRELFGFNRFGETDEIKQTRQFDKEKTLELFFKLDTNKKEDLVLALYLLSPYKKNKQVKEMIDNLRIDKYANLYCTYVFEGTGKHLYGDELNHDFRKSFLSQYQDCHQLINDLLTFYNLFGSEESWKIGPLIIAGFKYLVELNNSEYDSLVMVFLNGCGGTINFNPYNILKEIKNKKSFLKTLDNSNYPDKELIISQLLLSMSFNEIDEDIYIYALSFYTHRTSIVYGNDNIVSLYCYELFKKGFIYQILKTIKIDLTNCSFVEHLFTDEKRLSETIAYFQNDIILMKKVYFDVLKMSQFCDYYGVYIHYLTLADNTALYDFLKILYDGKSRIEIRPWLFNLNGFVDSFINLIDKTKFSGLSFFVGHTVNLMPDDVFIDFIKSFIIKHKKDPNKLQSLSLIIFHREKPRTQTTFFKALVKQNIPVSTLEIMQLFNGPHSWSGSVVPYINENIKEINELIFSGVVDEPYISFLKKLSEYQEKRLKEEEIREFNRDD